MKGNLKYYAAALTASVMWGFFAIPLRALKAFPSDLILCWRIFISLGIASLVSLLFRRRTLQTEWKDIQAMPIERRNKIFQLIISSTLLVTANWFSFIYVINHVSIQAGAFAYMICPIITALLGFYLLKEQLSQQKWLAMGIALLSVLLLSWGFYKDVAYSIFIAFLYAFYLIQQKQIERLHKFSILNIQLVLSTVLVIPYFIWIGAPAALPSLFWLNIAVIALLFTIIPLFLNLYSLGGLSSGTVGILIYVNPITAFTLAFTYFGEQPSVRQVLAYLLLLAAVLLFNGAFLKGLLARKSN